MRKPTSILLVLLTAGWLLVPAPGEELKYVVKKDDAPDSKVFPEIQREARRLDQLVITAILVPTRQTVEEGFPAEGVREFGRLVRSDVSEKLGPFQFDKLGAQLDYFAATLSAGEGFPKSLPEFAVTRDGFSLLTYRFTNAGGELTGSLDLTGDNRIAVVVAHQKVDTTREDALQALSEAIFPYKRNAASFTAYKARVQLIELADQWDAYFEKARPQSFLDILLTTACEYQHIKTDHLVGPPPRQWFLFHPNVVIENISAAPDGDQLGGAVAIEWVGINWWKLKVPLGLSLCSLYSDRPGVKDVGHGVAIYIANKYCIGWASHGGDNGFYASIDALKFIDSKKAKIENYRSRISTLLNH